MSNPKLSNTRFKLNEASYFLGQLSNTIEKTEYFLYNLSAFLAAARSVIDVMKEEFKHDTDQGFRSWFEPEKQILWNMGFREINALRVLTIHHEGNMAAKVKKDWSGYITMVSGNTTITSHSAVLPIDYTANTWSWKFQGVRQPVIHVCQRYFDLLSKMVEDCETRF